MKRIVFALFPLLIVAGAASAQDGSQKAAAMLAEAEARLNGAVATYLKLKPENRVAMQQDYDLWRERTKGQCLSMASKEVPGSIEARITVTKCWSAHSHMRSEWIENAARSMQTAAMNTPIRTATVARSTEATKAPAPTAPPEQPESAVDTAVASYEAADKALNAAYKKALAAKDAAGKIKLRNEQRAWIANRDKKCNEDNFTVAAEVENCLIEVTGERATELHRL